MMIGSHAKQRLWQFPRSGLPGRQVEDNTICTNLANVALVLNFNRACRWRSWNALGRNWGLLTGLKPKCKRDDRGDVSIRSVNFDRYTKGTSKETRSLETLLVVGTTTTNKEVDGVADGLLPVLFESADNAFEDSSNVSKVGNTATNDRNFVIKAWFATSNEVN